MNDGVRLKIKLRYQRLSKRAKREIINKDTRRNRLKKALDVEPFRFAFVLSF